MLPGTGLSGEAGARGDALVARFALNLVTAHDAAGDVVFAGGAVTGMLGIDAAELSGNGLFERIHLTDRPNFLNAVARALHGADGPQIEMRLRTGRPGSAPADFLWVEMRAQRATDSGYRAICTFADIDARHRQAADIQAASPPPERLLDARLCEALLSAETRLEAAERNLALTAAGEAADAMVLIGDSRGAVRDVRAVLDHRAKPEAGRAAAGLGRSLRRVCARIPASGGPDVACEVSAEAETVFAASAIEIAASVLIAEAVRLSGSAPVAVNAIRDGRDALVTIAHGTNISSPLMGRVWIDMARDLLPPGASLTGSSAGRPRLMLRLPAEPGTMRLDLADDSEDVSPMAMQRSA